MSSLFEGNDSAPPTAITATTAHTATDSTIPRQQGEHNTGDGEGHRPPPTSSSNYAGVALPPTTTVVEANNTIYSSISSSYQTTEALPPLSSSFNSRHSTPAPAAASLHSPHERPRPSQPHTRDHDLNHQQQEVIDHQHYHRHDLNTAAVEDETTSSALIYPAEQRQQPQKESLSHAALHHRRIDDRSKNRLSTSSLPHLDGAVEGHSDDGDLHHSHLRQQQQTLQSPQQQQYPNRDRGLSRLPGSQLSTRSEMDLRSGYRNKGTVKGKRRRQYYDDGSQLSPLPHSSSPRYHQSSAGGGTSSEGGGGPPSPSSFSARSDRSKRSSIRRAAAREAAAAEQLAGQQNLTVISRSMSSYRVVHMLYQTDADLFDSIVEWKEQHPNLWVDDAIDAFSSARGSDALAQLVYSTEAFDIILKYNASREDLAPIFDNHTRGDRPRVPSGLTPAQQEQQQQQSTDGTLGPSAFAEGVDLSTVIGTDSRLHSRLSQLRQSSGELLSRALSIRSSSRSRQSTPNPPQQQTTFSDPEDCRPMSLPHVSLTMHSSPPQEVASSTGPIETPFKPFQLLEPLDCSTDIFPSVRSSTVVADSDPPSAAVSSVIYTEENQIQTHPQPQSSIRQPPRERQEQQTQQQVRDWTKFSAPAPRRRKSVRPSKAKMREWKIQLHRREFQLALLKEGVFFELEKTINSDAVYVKVLAPFWRLGDEAQKTNCKADLASAVMPSIPYSSRIFPSITRLFPCLNQPGLEQRREAILFKTTRLTDYHLAEHGRRWSDVVRHSGAINRDGSHVGSNTGTDGRSGFFQTSRRGYLVNSIMMRTESRNNPYSRKTGLRSALRRGAYQKLYALHDGTFRLKDNNTSVKNLHEANYRAQLRVKWAKKWWKNQPLDLVNAYYGERVGIYFAWLGHYTKWLTLPATVGMAVFVFGIINAARLNKLDATPNALFAIFDNVLTMPFALFMSIWSTIYIEFWKRANQYYAYRWNMNDYERVELPRTEFRATKVRFSPVTGKKELYYPLYWKALRILASSLAVLAAVSVVIASVACLMIFKAWCRHHIGGPYWTVVAVALLNLIIIIVLGEIWCRLAEWLTDKENHKYTDAYESSLIIKRYLFDFANMYATLFYYAFFKAPFGGKIFRHRPDLQDTCLYDACITELTVQLAVVFIGKQFLNGLFEMVFPWIKRTWNRKKILADQALKRLEFLENRKRTRAPQWVKDDDLPSYEGRILKCYRKTVIQFGFCTLFVTSFPVAPAFALINNWIDIRMEAFRLLTQYRRPIAYRAQDIGIWEKIMEFVSFCSVITNAAIIAFSSLWIKQNLFVKYLHANDEGELLAARLGFILVFEHVVFLFKIILRASIPSVPLTIKLAVARSKHMSRVANEGLDSELGDEDLDVDSLSEYGDYDDEDDEEEDGYVTDDEDDGNGGAYDDATGVYRRGSQESRKMVNRDELLQFQGIMNNTSASATTDNKKPSRPGLGLQRIWSETLMRNKNSKPKRNSSPSLKRTLSPLPPPIQTRGLGGNLPTIQESMHGPSRTNGVYKDKQPEQLLQPSFEPQEGLGVYYASDPGYSTVTEGPQHPYPFRHYSTMDPSLARPQQQLSPSQSQRRPTPQRMNTDMDGEWVVLEGSRL